MKKTNAKKLLKFQFLKPKVNLIIQNIFGIKSQLKHPENLNINSLRYKFDFLVEMIGGNIDILVIGETKLNSSFPKVVLYVEYNVKNV